MEEKFLLLSFLPAVKYTLVTKVEFLGS